MSPDAATAVIRRDHKSADLSVWIRLQMGHDANIDPAHSNIIRINGSKNDVIAGGRQRLDALEHYIV